MGMPNLRFNKSLTKKLLHSKISEDRKVNFKTMDWGQDNKDYLYGSVYWRPFIGGYLFFVYKEEDRYKLIVINKKGLVGIYLIADIEEYCKYIDIGKLDTDAFIRNKKLLENLGLTGYLEIEGDLLFLYDHVEV